MSKLIVKSTDKKGNVKEKVFTEKEANKALFFLMKEFAKGHLIEKRIVDDGISKTE